MFFRLKNLLCRHSSLAIRSLSSTTMKHYKLKPSASDAVTHLGRRNSLDALYRRISPIGDPSVSIIPIIDKWIEEGHTVDKEQLLVILKELRFYRRYKHALEISIWMTEKRFYSLSSRDVAIRLDLITKVHGIELAEYYFETVSTRLRSSDVYSSLVNCYAHVKNVAKAEAALQKVRDLGFVRNTLPFNVLLKLYGETQNFEKVETLMKEMKECVGFDKFTFSILLGAYAANYNIAEMERILSIMESSQDIGLDWTVYAVAANGFSKLGLPDRAFSMLKKSEELVSAKKRKQAFAQLITMYALVGKKEEVTRLWEICKKEKIYNNGYRAMITALIMFNDIECAEKIFEEWDSQGLTYDVRIPNQIISAYSRKGLLMKAESLFNRILMKGGKADANTWYYLASGYLRNGDMMKAVEYIKEALSVDRPSWRWKPHISAMATCLNYLKCKGDIEGAKRIITLLKNNNHIALDTHDRLLNWVDDVDSGVEALNQLLANDLVGNVETSDLDPEEERSEQFSS